MHLTDPLPSLPRSGLALLLVFTVCWTRMCRVSGPDRAEVDEKKSTRFVFLTRGKGKGKRQKLIILAEPYLGHVSGPEGTRFR